MIQPVPLGDGDLLLLRAALLPDEAPQRWREWSRSHDLDRLTPEAYSLLPRVARALEASGEVPPRVAGVLRKTFAESRVWAAEARQIAELLPGAVAAGRSAVAALHPDPAVVVQRMVELFLAPGGTEVMRRAGWVLEHADRGAAWCGVDRFVRGGRIVLLRRRWLWEWTGLDKGVVDRSQPAEGPRLPDVTDLAADLLLDLTRHPLPVRLDAAAAATELVRAGGVEWERLESLARASGTSLRLAAALQLVSEFAKVPSALAARLAAAAGPDEAPQLDAMLRPQSLRNSIRIAWRHPLRTAAVGKEPSRTDAVLRALCCRWSVATPRALPAALLRRAVARVSRRVGR